MAGFLHPGQPDPASIDSSGRVTVRNIGCPGCGGVLPPPEAGCQVVCGFCGGLYILGGEWEGRYTLPLTTERGAAQDIVRASIRRLRGRGGVRLGVNPRFADEARPAGAQLYFVPFFRYSGLRLGTAPMNREHEVRTHTDLGDRDQGEIPLSTTIEMAYKVESKVVLAEVGMVLPALALSGERARRWGLDRLLREQDFLSGRISVGEPFRRERLAARGTVLSPSRPAADVLRMCRQMYAYRKTTRADDVEGYYAGPDRRHHRRVAPASKSPLGVESTYTMDHEAIEYSAGIVGDRVNLYWCPLWRVELEFGGRRWTASVDGVRGDLVSLEAPAASAPRPWRLLAASLAGGQLLGGAFWLVRQWAAPGEGDMYFGLASLAGLPIGYWLYREGVRLDHSPIPPVRVLYADDLPS